MKFFSSLLLLELVLGVGLPIIGDLCKRDNPCVAEASCIIDPAAPVVGRPFCICPQGFDGDGRRDGLGCIDVDECSLGLADCASDGEECHNIVGSYTCMCKTGYTKSVNDRHCKDINECLDPYACGDNQATCFNLPGSFACACVDSHMSFVNGRCVKKDFCTDPDFNMCDRMHGICVSGPDGAECLCSTGFALNDDGLTCVDVNECETGEHKCPLDVSACVNTDGGYECECLESKGWTNSGIYECSNLNECVEYPDVCGDGVDCCKDLPPPRKFVCSSTMPLDDKNLLVTESAGINLMNPLTFVTHSANQVKKFLTKIESTTLSKFNNRQAMLPHDSFWTEHSLLENYRPKFPRQLSSVTDQVVRYSVETASQLIPALINQDRGVCPAGFTDLRPIKRHRIISKVPEASSRLLDWLREFSPLKLHDLENVEPAAVAVGMAHNAKNFADMLGEWYKAISAIPQALDGNANKFITDVNITKDLNTVVNMANRVSQPIKEMVSTVKSLAPQPVQRAGSQDLGLPIAL